MSFKKFLKNTPYSNRLSYDDLVNAESALGRTLFGPMLPGTQREFFKSRGNVWIWHENNMTIRYEVRPEGVYKRTPNGNYSRLEGMELENFRRAAKSYLELVKTKLYC